LSRKVRVGVNGYGTIGKRVAWAVSLQPDMEVVGVVKTKPTWEALSAVAKGFKIYVPEGKEKMFEDAGIKVAGTIDDLIASVDVVVDATPAGVGASYASLYRRAGVKAIFQGGEARDVAEVSFNALHTYREALGRDAVRVVSCNTTGMLRVIYAVSRVARIRSVRGVIVRRGADLKEVKKGPIEGLLLKPVKPPSHHALDVKAVVGDWLDIITYAVVAPTTLAHLHILNFRLDGGVRRDEIIESLRSTPRVILLDSAYAPTSTAEVRELARDLGRCGDIYEVVVWGDSVWVEGEEVSLAYMVHQEAIVVPENVDAIRAVTRLTDDPVESIRLTDKALGIGGWMP